MPLPLNRLPRGRELARLIATGAAWLAVFAVAGVIGGLLFTWSGLYSVAASRGHWPGFGLLLEFGMRSSVRTHALGIAVPDLSDRALVERGAAHFQGGCAPCHAAPGQPASPIVRAMLPEPSDLKTVVPTWKPNQLFWIVKNGLKYTGMPGWSAPERDDEVWAVVAFLQQLPSMDTETYRALASLEPRATEVPIRLLAQGGPAEMGLTACSRCHGLDGLGRSSGAFPRLDIQSADYLFDQLQAYASGRRQSGIMQPVAAELEAREMRRLADYYAGRRTAQSPPRQQPAHGLSPDLGQRLFVDGLAEQGIPSCASCHAQPAPGQNRFYPALAGQYAGYTSHQLRMFKAGKRQGTPAADIMTVVARRMTEEQIDAVASYVARLPRLETRP